MAANTLVLADGILYSWGSIKLILFGSPVVGIEKISYKTTQKKDNVYGIGRNPIGRGYGNFEYEASIEILLEQWKQICQAAPNGDPLQIAPFTITVTYGLDSGVIPYIDYIENCEFLSNPIDANQGDTHFKLTIPLICAGISRFN